MQNFKWRVGGRHKEYRLVAADLGGKERGGGCDDENTQGFMRKKEGPLDGDPIWQEPQIKKKQSSSSLTNHITASLAQSSWFPHKMLNTSG